MTGKHLAFEISAGNSIMAGFSQISFLHQCPVRVGPRARLFGIETTETAFAMRLNSMLMSPLRDTKRILGLSNPGDIDS